MASKREVISQITDNLRRVFHAVNVYSRKAKKHSGLTGPQIWAIKIVADCAPITVSQLSGKMYLHPATVVGILNRLETGGFVKRIRSKADRRIVQVGLTKAGRDLVERSPEVAQGLLITGLESLSILKLCSMSRCLAELVSILGAQELPPKLLLSKEVNRVNASRIRSKGGRAKAGHED